MTVALVLALIVFIYPFTIYPALLWIFRGRTKSPRQPAVVNPDELPTVALLTCAYNEEKVIAEKVRNTLAIEYPADKLRIVFVSDGSTDKTVEVVRSLGGSRVTMISNPKRRGKIRNINETIASLKEDIVVSTDANVLCHPKSVLQLVRNFQDPTVGCVSGHVVVTNTLEDIKAAEQQFFSMDWFLQERASQIYSMAGVDGAMYAFRRHLYQPCPDDTIIEDFLMAIKFVRQGKRIVFEPTALGREDGALSVGEEFRRKVRISAGAGQALMRGGAWPVGAPLRFWFIFLSHKLLRWLTPLTGTIALTLAMIHPTNILSQCVLAGALAMIGTILLRALTKWRHPLLDAPYYFLLGQTALALGLGKGLAGAQSVLWAKPNR